MTEFKNKKKTKDTFQGQVIKKLIAPGSKSERVALCLQMENGCYVLRKSRTPFNSTDGLPSVGMEVTCKGIIRGQTLFLTSWSEQDKPDNHQDREQ